MGVCIMKKIFMIAALIIALICSFANVDCVKGIQYIKILPWCYLICFFSSKENKKMMNGPGMFMLNIIMFARYCLVPLSICINNNVNHYANNYQYLSEAILIMIIEMLSVFITLKLIRIRNRPKKSPVFSKIMFSELPNNIIFLLIAVIIIAGLIISNRDIIGSFYIITGGVVQNDIASNASGLTMMFWKGFVTFLFIYFIGIVKNNKQSDGIKVVISIVLCLGYMLLMYIGQASIARWFLLSSAVIILFILVDMYPDYKISIFSAVAIPVICLLISASIIKNTSLTGNYDLALAIKELLSPVNMDTYFAGPVSVNNAIGMKLNSNVSILNLPYDLLNNFPGIADSVDKYMVTNRIYNAYIFHTVRNDQILPLIGQSFALFSFLGTPLLSILATRLVVYFDKKYYEARDLRGYCFGFCAVWVGISMVLNMTITISWFYSIIVPLYLIIWCYQKCNFKK